MTDESPDDLPPEILAVLRAPVPVDDGRREVHISAALDHFDALAAAGDDATDRREERPAPVIDIRSRRRPARWLGAAAALLLVVGGAILATRGNSPGSVQTADRAERTTAAVASPRSAQDSGGFSTGSADGAAPVPSTTTMATGPVTVAPSLAQMAAPAAEKAAPGATQATAGRTPSMCRAPHLRAALMAIAMTTVDGRPQLVYSYVSGPWGTVTITITVDAATCART